MIKLALLIPTLDRSGAEKQLTLLATGLPRDEFSTHVVCLTRGGPYEADLAAAGIPVTILHKRMKFDPGTFLRLRQWIQVEKPDLLHTWLFAANGYGRLVAGNSDGPKRIVSERCVDDWKSGWQTWLDRCLVGRTDQFIANSESVAEFYRHVGIPESRMQVIRNGVPQPKVDPERTAALRRELQIAPTTRVVGFVGRLARQKRVKDLIWGFQLLRQISEEVCFVVVGDGPLRADLEKLARHFDCHYLMRFVGHRNDAADFYPMFRALWLASEFEGMSNSVMEAMSHGIPIVATDIPPNRELVRDGETGFLVKLGDSVGFAQFTDRILADPELAGRLGEAGRARMSSEFSVPRMVAEHAELYRRIAGRLE